MIYYMFVLIPCKEEAKTDDVVLLYLREGNKFTRGWQEGMVGRLIKKETDYKYSYPYKVFSKVEQGEILIIDDYIWREIK